MVLLIDILLVIYGPGRTNKSQQKNITSTSVFQSASVLGWTFPEYQHSRKPWMLVAMAKKDFIINMRHTIYSFFLALIFLSNKGLFAQKNNLSIYKSHFDNELKSWTKTINDFKLSLFKPTDTIPFGNLNANNIKSLNDFYSIYKPALTFSKDSNKFIDIYSYGLNLEKRGNKIVYSGSEADQAISLCNIKTKKWTQILFCGYSLRMQEVIWLTNIKFMLVGSVQNEESRYLPVIYIGDIANNSFETFTSSDPKCFQKEGYESPKLAKLNIQEE